MFHCKRKTRVNQLHKVTRYYSEDQNMRVNQHYPMGLLHYIHLVNLCTKNIEKIFPIFNSTRTVAKFKPQLNTPHPKYWYYT